MLQRAYKYRVLQRAYKHRVLQRAKFNHMEKVIFQDLGHIAYAEAWAYQERLHTELISRKRKGEEPSVRTHYLLFCEHPPVYTLGKSGSIDHLLMSEEELRERGVDFFRINRGGDITYHGPGQIVGYPIFDLDGFFTDVHRYVRYLEEAVIRTLAEYGIEAGRVEKYTGVWLPAKGFLPQRKICAIGVHLSRWVTLHGFALNVNTDLSFFRGIVPCGIQEEGKDVTSMQMELGREVDVEEVKAKLKRHFAELFEFEFVH